MRFLTLAAVLFVGQPAAAQQIGPPLPNCPARIQINTPTTTYVGVFQGENRSGNDVYWVVRTDSGTTTIPPSIVRSVTCVVDPGSLELRLHGSNTIGATLAPAFGQAYAKKDRLPDVKIVSGPGTEDFDMTYSAPGTGRTYVFHFRAEGSAKAFEALLARSTDIGMSSRRITDSEVALLRDAGFGNMRAPRAENVIGLDAVVVIVNPSSPVGVLSLDQIARIFSGEIQDWGQVGGRPGPINVYARDDRSGTFDTFRSLVLQAGPVRTLQSSAKRFISSEELSDSVAADPRGIGFIGFAYVRSAKALQISSGCGLQFSAEPFLVKSEEYPLSRRLYFYVPETNRIPQVENFIAFALSAAVQPVTAATGFIGLNIEEAPASYNADRERHRNLDVPDQAGARRAAGQFSQTIAAARRLSVTFRFNTNSTDLDNRALEDVRRLAEHIRANPGMEQRVMLLGFADAVGSFESNLELSRMRAARVARELSLRGVTAPSGQIHAFSMVSPVACNGSSLGLEKNRRVEVWVRR
jgi:phosphate transport system substrate-binding protein